MEICILSTSFLIFLISLGATEEVQVFNQSCQYQSDCGPFGYICETLKTCQCDKWYIPNRTRERCVGGVGRRCKYDEHCIDGAFCEHQSRCKCKEGFSTEDNGLLCSSAEPFFNLQHVFYVTTLTPVFLTIL